MRSQPLCVLTLLVAAGCARLSSVDLPAPQEAPLVESLRPDSAGRFLVKLASPAYLTAIAYDGRSQPLVFYVDDVPSQPPAPGVEPVAIGVPRLPAPRWNPAYVGFTSGRPLCSAQLEGTISTEQGLRPSYGYVCDGPSGGTTPPYGPPISRSAPDLPITVVIVASPCRPREDRLAMVRNGKFHDDFSRILYGGIPGCPVDIHALTW